MLTYPTTWPEGCPPADAADAEADVFRVVHQPYEDDDFRSYDDLGKLPTAPQCKRVSLSVFNTAPAACHQAKKYPYLGDHVAKARLTPAMGKLSTASTTGHQEWWAPDGFDRASVFTEVKRCP